MTLKSGLAPEGNKSFILHEIVDVAVDSLKEGAVCIGRGMSGWR